MTDQLPEDLAFEDALAQLEDITHRLESDAELSLDESVALFEQGQKLAAFCQEKLDSAELRVREIAPDD